MLSIGADICTNTIGWVLNITIMGYSSTYITQETEQRRYNYVPCQVISHESYCLV